jgi:D-3-phosphoglycerate dehydrogenase / 2-oxoglutarate reductase
MTSAGTTRTVVLVSEIASDPRLPGGLRDAGFETVDRIGLTAAAPTSAVIEAIRPAWGVIAGGERYDAEVLGGLPDLRVIVRPGAGFDSIDIAAATHRGVLVATTPAANAEAVADMTVGLMLACLRLIPTADHAVRAGRWRPDVFMGRDLFRRTVGIVGLGRIGRAVAQRLQGFECRLLGFDPFADEAYCRAHGIGLRSLEDLLGESDVVTLHLPLSTETRGLLGTAEFARMRPGSVLINTSRGPIVDEAALVRGLGKGRPWSAGLDVFDVEPLPPDHPFRTTPNMVLTGHIASYTGGAYDLLVDGAIQAMVAARDGRAPVGTINHEVLGIGRRD